MIDGKHLDDRGRPSMEYLSAVMGVHPETLAWSPALTAFKRLHMPYFVAIYYRTFTELLRAGVLLELRGSWHSDAPDGNFGLRFEFIEDADYIQFISQSFDQ